jgi:hypothetical protein
MKISTPLLLALAPVLALGRAPAQETSEFGEPLIVNGKRISDLAIKRYLCYGKGRNALESTKLGVLLEQEWQLREYLRTRTVLDEQFDGKDLEELSAEEQERVQAEVAQFMGRYTYEEEEYVSNLAKEEKSFFERYPTLDLDVEIGRAYKSVDWYEDQVRQTLQFDQMFFPGHPDNWPEITIEAVHAGSPGFDLVADFAKNYELRREAWLNERSAAEQDALTSQFAGKTRDQLGADELAALDKAVDEAAGKYEPREDEMMMSLLRDYIIASLSDPNLVTIKTSVDGLPEELVMTVEGGGFKKDLATEDIYAQMKHTFNAHDIADAKLFLALRQATHDRLSGADQLMPYEDFQDMVVELKSQLQSTMFNFDFLALHGHMFPSQEAYIEHLFLMESYRKVLEPDMELGESGELPEALQAHMPIANGIMGLAKAHAEVLLVSAYDFPNDEWKESGWATAEERAFQLRAEIDEHLDYLAAEETRRRAAAAAGENYQRPDDYLSFEEFWAQKLDYESEYWDPPMPVSGKMPAMVGMKNKGRFGGVSMTRNDMKRAIGESSFSHYLGNFAIVDAVFFDLEPGQVGGPYLGPKGYYIVYLKSRQPPTNPLNYRDERHLGMIREDFVRLKFTEYCHESLEQAEISGL